MPHRWAGPAGPGGSAAPAPRPPATLTAASATPTPSLAIPMRRPMPIKLRFAHTVSTEDTAHKAIIEFAKRVKDKTGGRAEIEIFPAAQLGNDPKVLEGTRLGTIDIGTTGNPFFTAFNPEMNVLDSRTSSGTTRMSTRSSTGRSVSSSWARWRNTA